MTFLVEEGRRLLNDWMEREGADRTALARVVEGLAGTAGRSGLDPLQQPSILVPGLTARPWWDTERFPWVGALEQAIDKITAEFEASGGSSAERVVRNPANRADRGRWSVRYLYYAGRAYERNLTGFPETVRALRPIPGACGCGMTYFSVLDPHTHVAAHSGFTNAHLRCHLSLSVPDGDCRLRVGTETRRWEAGRVLVFDDSYEHEAWNDTDHARAVLLFDIWHPELSEAEIRALDYLMGVWRKLLVRRVWFPELAGTR